ncbi:MAG: protein TolQ [Proteobacteria bacterium]|nr:protein TolQ [Pseudomonadota bacterium]MBW3616392.1 protein TolQ [Pseudomonadota bacterium]
MAPDPALTAESFSAVSLFLRADWVVKLVMIGLAAASLWSWTIILDKLLRFSALNRQANAFEDEVGSGRSLEEVAAKAGDQPRHALPRMLVVALREWRETRSHGPVGETAGALMMQRIDRGLDGVIARESQRVEDGLGSLAIVATASPFVGLFGTVWGIMNAFQEIAVQRSTNLTVVAPAIAEALFATAIGLIAAIPAYIAYNKFSTDAGRFAGRLEGFADDLTAAMARRLAQPQRAA